jgi:hypothetical protein
MTVGKVERGPIDTLTDTTENSYAYFFPRKGKEGQKVKMRDLQCCSRHRMIGLREFPGDRLH